MCFYGHVLEIKQVSNITAPKESMAGSLYYGIMHLEFIPQGKKKLTDHFQERIPSFERRLSHRADVIVSKHRKLG
jgi:hypothetical protein